MANTRWDANIAALQAETGMVNTEVALLAGHTTAGDGGGGSFEFETAVPTSATVTAATNTSPILIGTSAAHGLVSGNRVMVAGVGGNNAANGTKRIWVGGAIIAATNASPIKITASGAHGLVTGDTIVIGGVLGNTAANGAWTVTVVDHLSFTLNTSTGNGDYTSGGNFTKLAANKISAATNASPIAITTSAAHGLATGLQVTIAGVVGNTAANGTWTITVTGATTFTLNTSTGNGVYASGGLVVTTTTFSLEGTTGSGAYTSGGWIGDGGTTIPSASATTGRWRRLS
jgi:hypothetical protein